MSTTVVPSDIEIAQRVKMRPIEDVAAELGLERDELDLHGKYIAKIPLDIAQRPIRGRLVVVTATNPTPAGEGKSTVSVGLAQALRRMGQKVALCIREPSLGPVFGVKGGAAGGGYAQVVPMDDINLHFTGDFHAISSAHALLAAMLDNHLQQGNALGIDPRRITWPRTIDMNDRALRNVIVGLGGVGDGVPREEHFVIVPASEIMAIVALATSAQDLEERLARIILGSTYGAAKRPVTAGELRAAGAMALLLKDAIRPNLVQTLEGGPAFVHAGPFGNIAHGCNSILATRSALALADLVVTEAGFGSDLGAEKFFDIKCRMGGLNPEAAVIVATVRSLKMHGGADKKNLGVEDLRALERGLPNLEKHVENVRHFGVPGVVALNRRSADSDAELALVADFAKSLGVPLALTEVWEKGGAGGEALGAELMALARQKGRRVSPALRDGPADQGEDRHDRPADLRRRRAPTTRPKRIARSRTWSRSAWATRRCAWPRRSTRSPTTRRSSGRPRGFRITVNEVRPSAGAGFVVAQCGDIMTMPGLPKEPAAERMARLPSGEIVGLF